MKNKITRIIIGITGYILLLWGWLELLNSIPNSTNQYTRIIEAIIIYGISYIIGYNYANFMLKVKFKIIKTNNKWFIIRFSYPYKAGSIKLHIILRDDEDKPHNHPWDFTSFLIIPYKESLYKSYTKNSEGYVKEWLEIQYYKPFTLVKRTYKQLHKTELYKIFGIKIPAITIGKYSEKKQLCSFCKDLGYCKENK